MLDRLKRDRLIDKVGEEVKNVGLDGGVMIKDYVEYMLSVVVLSNSVGLRDYGMEWIFGWLVFVRKFLFEMDVVVWFKVVFLRFLLLYRKGYLVYRFF